MIRKKAKENQKRGIEMKKDKSREMNGRGRETQKKVSQGGAID